MVAWHSTEHLILDRDGVLWQAVGGAEEGPTRRFLLGPIGDAPDLAGNLEDERAECLDLWRDAFDDRGEQLWNYRNRG